MHFILISLLLLLPTYANAKQYVTTLPPLDYEYVLLLADYRATPGNLGALIAVRDLDDDRAEVITLSWWPSMDAIRGFAGDDVERAVYYPQDDRYLLTTPEKVQHYQSHGAFDPPTPG